MATTNDRMRWYGVNIKDRTMFDPGFKVKPGRIKVRHKEWAKQYAGMLMIEPHIKGTFSGDNKRWPWEYWQQLVDRCDLPMIQCHKPGARTLRGLKTVETPNFDSAVSVLYHSLGIVVTEGGLHHAAGALGKPAVIIFGAFNKPSNFGYDFHVNIDEPDPEGLGWRKTHPACVAAMQRITPERVLEAVNKLWK